MKSIMQKTKKCYVCGTTYNLHKHHIFYGMSNRKNSEKHGCWCWLCALHHNASGYGVHFDKALDEEIKKRTQRKFEQTHSRNEFMQIFGRSWL